MHVKKGDKVIVLAGADKGKSGVIAKVFIKDTMVLIDGINMKKKHRKARGSTTAGQVIEKAFPIHASNVKATDKKTK